MFRNFLVNTKMITIIIAAQGALWLIDYTLHLARTFYLLNDSHAMQTQIFTNSYAEVLLEYT